MLDTQIVTQHELDLELAAALGRAVILGLIAGNLDPERAGGLARMAGSYGRRALAHQEVVREGWSVIRGAFGVEL